MDRIPEQGRERAQEVSGETHGQPGQFLADASRLLADSLDYETTLHTVAGLALPHLGGWSIVDIVEGEGEERSIRRLAIVHPDPEKQRIARELKESWPPEAEDPIGAPVAVRTREPQVVTDVDDEMLREVAKGEENLERLRALGIGSFVVVPLISRNRVLGAMTFVAPEPGEAYAEDNRPLAKDLAARCALAIDNVRHYQAAEDARRESDDARQGAEDARRTAEDALSARDEVLGIVSHDLRNPLNAISTAAQLLQMFSGEEESEKAERQLKVIVRSAERMERLTNDLLDTSRIESGHFDIDAGEEDAAALVEEACSIARPGADQSSIALTCEAAGDLPPVRADRDRVLQVLDNLIGNAVKFTPAGGTIAVRAAPVDGAVRFSVADTGPGIPEEEREHLFDRFWHTRNKEHKGAGLGLAICKGIAQAHGGEIWCESTEGEGSTFFFTLPVGDNSAK